jgi:hypothetical protein
VPANARIIIGTSIVGLNRLCRDRGKLNPRMDASR